MAQASVELPPLRDSAVAGLIGGLLHAGIAVFLWNHFGFDNLWELLILKPLTGGYILLGMFVLGSVPAMFYAGREVISPGFLVAALFLLSGIGSWQALPGGAPRGAPTPFGLYILLWVGVIALVSLAGVVELKRKTRKPA